MMQIVFLKTSVALQELKKAVKELFGFLTVHPMPGTRNILKFCLSEKFFDQVMVSHRNVVAICAAYKKCGTLQTRKGHPKKEYSCIQYTSYTAPWGSGNTEIVSRKARWIASRLILHPISLKRAHVKQSGGSVLFYILSLIPGFRMLTHVHQKPCSQPCVSYSLRKLIVGRFSCS